MIAQTSGVTGSIVTRVGNLNCQIAGDAVRFEEQTADDRAEGIDDARFVRLNHLRRDACIMQDAGSMQRAAPKALKQILMIYHSCGLPRRYR